MTSLRVHDLEVGYRATTVLSGVSTTVDTGGWLGVIGPNGSGKSTLIKAVAGLLGHRGNVLVDGRSVTGMRRKQRARLIGYSPQIPLLPLGLTVTDYVLLGRTPHLSPLGREGREDLDAVAAILDRLDLSALADRKLTTLSGGERQRTVLARALAQQAGVLLLDEPTTGLDVGHAQALLDLVDEIRHELGTTVVTTLHDLTLAAQYAERLVLLDAGGVAAEGRPSEVLTAEALAERYGARVTVLHTPGGAPVITPVRE